MAAASKLLVMRRLQGGLPGAEPALGKAPRKGNFTRLSNPPLSLLSNRFLFDSQSWSDRQHDKVKRLSTRPAWVIDNCTFDLFQIGMENEDLPEDLRLDAAMEDHILRLRAWAEKEVAQPSAGRTYM